MPEIDATLGAGIGLGFAFTASFASAVGLSLIKKAHNIKKAERSRKFTGPAKGLVVCGNFLLTFVSSSFDLVAMLFAPIELLSPVAGVTLILNIFVAPCIVHEKVHTVDLLSAAVMVPGLVMSIIFGPTGEQKMTTELLEERMGRSPWVAFELLVATLLLACLLVFRPRLGSWHHLLSTRRGRLSRSTERRVVITTTMPRLVKLPPGPPRVCRPAFCGGLFELCGLFATLCWYAVQAEGL